MLYFPFRFQVSLNSSFSRSRSAFPCDMGGELPRIKSRRVSFHPTVESWVEPSLAGTEKIA